MSPAVLAAAGLRRLRGGAAQAIIWSFIAGVVTRAGLLALAIILARRLGPADYGVFTYTTGLAGLLAQFAGLGWPTLMNRLIPGFVRDGNWPQLRGLVRAGDVIVIGLSLVVAALLWGLSPLAQDLSHGVALSAVLLPAFALAILRRQQLAAVKRSSLGLLFDQGFGSIFVAIVILVVGTLSIDATIWGFALATLGGCLIATIVFRSRLPADTWRARSEVKWVAWSAIAFPMVIGLSAKLLMNRTDILLLAPLSDLHETGLYGAAFRITYLLTFPQVVLTSVMTPMFSDAFTHDRIDRARVLLRMAMAYALVTTLPLVIAIGLFAPDIMALVFGEPFREAGATLLILTFGQLAAALTLPYASILMMGGREKVFGILNIAALALNALVCVLLIPGYGAIGAAVASLISATLLLIGQAAMCRRLLGKKGEVTGVE